MSCECIDNFEQKLKEKTGDDEACVKKCFPYVNGKLLSLPYVACEAREKKKDGTFKKRPTEQPLIITYCPFCGTKVMEETKDA